MGWVRCPCRPGLGQYRAAAAEPGAGTGQRGLPTRPAGTRRGHRPGAQTRGPGRERQRGPPTHTATPTPAGRAVFVPLHRGGSAQPRHSGTQKGSFSQLRLKTFLEELWARKMLCKKSLDLGSQRFSFALAALRDAASRPGLSPCNVPRGERGFAQG